MNLKAGIIDDFEELLESAERNASKNWDVNFIASMRERYDEWGRNTSISDNQLEQLKRIANE